MGLRASDFGYSFQGLSFSQKIPDILVIQTNMPVAQQMAIILDLNNFIFAVEMRFLEKLDFRYQPWV